MSRLKEIAYEIKEHAGLWKGYLGAFLKFDGKFDNMDITVEYDGSNDTLKVFASPKFNPPTNTNVVKAIFTSENRYQVKNNSGEKIGSHNYTSASALLKKLKSKLDLKNERLREIVRKEIRKIIY